MSYVLLCNVCIQFDVCVFHIFPISDWIGILFLELLTKAVKLNFIAIQFQLDQCHLNLYKVRNMVMVLRKIRKWTTIHWIFAICLICTEWNCKCLVKSNMWIDEYLIIYSRNWPECLLFFEGSQCNSYWLCGFSSRQCKESFPCCYLNR